MNTIRLPFLIGITFYLAACSRPASEPAETPTPTPTPAASATPPPAAAQAATPPVAAATATPPKSYYLLERVSLTTEDGITNFPPGTKVIPISEDAEGIKVQTADGVQLVLKPSQITDSTAAGTQLSRADAEAKQRGDAARAKAVAAYKAEQALKAAAATQAQPVPRAATPAPFVSTVTDMNAPYNQQKHVAEPKKQQKKR